MFKGYFGERCTTVLKEEKGGRKKCRDPGTYTGPSNKQHCI
jgi:hypothetical protein